jgi:hypothetical protein
MSKAEAELPVKIQITYNALKGSPRTFHDPGYDSEIEVLNLKIFNEMITGALYDKLIKHLSGEITEVCEEQEVENEQETAVCAAEAARDRKEDR